MAEFNPWALSSGLPEAFTGQVKEAFFGYDDQYQDGDKCVLTLMIQTTETDIGEDGMLKVLYGLGDGWEPKNKGQQAEHEGGKPKAFNKSSAIGQLIQATFDVIGEDALIEKGMPWDAEIWNGMNYDWERKSFTGTFGGEKREWGRVLPVAVAEGGSTATKAKGATKKAAAKAETEETGDGATLPFKIKSTLKKIAAENADHDSYMEAAYDAVSGMDGWTDEFEDHITENGAGSIWADAQA